VSHLQSRMVTGGSGRTYEIRVGMTELEYHTAVVKAKGGQDGQFINPVLEKSFGSCHHCGKWTAVLTRVVGFSPVDDRVTFNCTEEHALQSSEK
jgi:hypothetical protein